MISRLVFFSTILVMVGCSTEPTQPQPSSEITNAEFTVLATIVSTLHVSSSDSVLVLIDSTWSGASDYNLDSNLTNTLQYVNQNIPTLKPETMQDYKSKNLTHTYIQNPLSIHPACVLSSKAHQSYPMIEVSRVGFSTDGQQALAYVGSTLGPLAGMGSFYVLSKENGTWVIVGVVLAWIS
jgi:hypothetical protein